MLDSWDIAEKDESNDAGVRPPAAAEPDWAADADAIADADGAADADAIADADGAADDGAAVGVGAAVGDGVAELLEQAAVSTMMAPAVAANLRIFMRELLR